MTLGVYRRSQQFSIILLVDGFHAFVRMNRRAIAIMLVCLCVYLSVWDGHALWSYGAI